MLDAYKDRRAQIGRAAVENCVEEQIAYNDCLENGGWGDTMTLCRSKNKAFERCYIMQSVELISSCSQLLEIKTLAGVIVLIAVILSSAS